MILNAAIGVFLERKAENALKSLKDMVKPAAKTIRGGQAVLLSSAELVPGDLILVEAGDSVPADARLIESVSLFADESALTGESVPVAKEAGAICEESAAPSEQLNMLFLGTTVTGGRGRAVVTATGMNTELGRIAHLLMETAPEPTPLQQRLSRLGKVLGMAAAALVAVVFLTGFLRGENLLELFMVAISLAVAGVPEGLPAVVTVVLALGVTRMSRQKAVVRKLPAVETLGTTTVICSDKTGTLTKNEMTVTGIYAGNKFYNVTGSGYEPSGDILDVAGQKADPGEEDVLGRVLLGGLLNNDARLERTEKGWRVVGDPTEGALLTAAAKAGLSHETALNFPRLAEIPFDSDRKMMTTFHRAGSGVLSYVKGAPDAVLRRCISALTPGGPVPLDREGVEKLEEINLRYASAGQRVLALAERLWPAVPPELSPESVEKDLTFLGFFVITDPLRPEAKEAVARCHRAGIRAVMITGDHLATAEAIAKELGIMRAGSLSLSGRQLEHMTAEELKTAAAEAAVFARVSPEHKLRIVEALKQNGHVVAMTGDGVNDAPALRRADIGVAMGLAGTEVAKQAADLVLLDDNFATIVKAVEEGRTIYSNIRSAIAYLLSCNTGEIFAIFSSILLGMGSPLTPIQILWLNLITDGPPALALGLEPPQKGVMERPPRRPGESFFAGGLGLKILWQGALIGLLSFLAFWLFQNAGRSLAEARTAAFATMALSQLVHSFNARSLEQSIFRLGFTTNRSLLWALAASLAALSFVLFTPPLMAVFDTCALDPSGWVLVAALSLTPLAAVEAGKRASALALKNSRRPA